MQGEGPALKSNGNYGFNDVLAAMRPMLPPKKQRMVDLMVKAMEMQKIWDEMRDTDAI
jgi:hypothetical protein